MATPIRESISSVAEKIQEIVEAAERVAREIQADAEAEASRYREDRRREADALAVDRAARLKELSASLSQHAERVRAEVTSLSAELSRAADELRGDGAAATPVRQAPPREEHQSSEGDLEPSEERDLHGKPGWLRRHSPLGRSSGPETPQPVAYPGSAAGESQNGPRCTPEGAHVPDEALLRATQMAVAGSSREEIEEALRRDFDLADPAAVADEILGNAEVS